MKMYSIQNKVVEVKLWIANMKMYFIFKLKLMKYNYEYKTVQQLNEIKEVLQINVKIKSQVY